MAPARAPTKVLQRADKISKIEVVNVHRLKPHLGKAPVEAAFPPHAERKTSRVGSVAASVFPAASTGGGGGLPVENGIGNAEFSNKCA
jgi:hypothetical protein